VHQVKAVELQVAVPGFESFLGKIERLLDQVRVRVAVHGEWRDELIKGNFSGTKVVFSPIRAGQKKVPA
jgi:hypothetical protein